LPGTVGKEERTGIASASTMTFGCLLNLLHPSGISRFRIEEHLRIEVYWSNKE